jgi:ubiquinone/menaquinone biosynthesis C-methylase UbiE
MSSILPFTGERFTPECSGEIWHEHWHRYLFAQRLAPGKVVLDVACGEGYGSAFMARQGATVIGVDVDAEAVGHAKTRYSAIPGLSFRQGSAAQLPLADASVDMIVSFETLEHLAEQEEMLAEFQRVLRPDGFLVMSSPNKPIYSDAMNYRNEYHVRELDRAELAALLQPHFPVVRWYGQRLVFQSMLWVLDSVPGTAENLQVAGASGDPLPGTIPPMYYLVVCGRDLSVMPDTVDVSLLGDGGQAIYADYMATYRRWKAAAERCTELERLTARSSASSVDESMQRDQGLGADVSRDDSAARRVAELEARLAYRESLTGWVRYPLGVVRRWLAGENK